jgi:hypothetical protein
MKLSIISVLAISILSAFSCQRENPEKEKAAIMEVLKEEAAATVSGDFERYQATHLQDDLETRVEMGIYNYNIYKGWDEVGKVMNDYIHGNSISNAVNRKENVRIKVNGNSAWLLCDNIWETDAPEKHILVNNLQTVFLEKVNGVWKISFASYYSKGNPDEIY